MIFGLGSEPGSTNLLTRALAAVDERVESVPDPVQIHYHLPDPRLDHLRVHRDYAQWLEELTQRFPHECRGIRGFYDECWAVFRALNALELLSLEEPRYLLRVFLQNPLACFTLLRYLGVNVGDVARRWIRDEALLRFIDIDCYVWSVAAADRTPMINGGMVFSDRHYGGINYPVGGVGTLAERLANALRDQERFPGCWVEYGARAVRVNVDGQRRATGVTLADGRQIRARAVISNATRWDTFGLAGADESVPRALVDAAEVPPTERLWRQWYTESPSFLSLHLGVRADALDAGHAHLRDCHHIVLEEWAHMESATDAAGTIFVSIPTVLDASVAPPGRHIFHVFTPSWMSEWRGLGHSEYRARKQQLADRLIERLERRVFPGLRRGIEVFEVGTPRTHRRFLGRKDGTYGPIAARRLHGLLTMPFNRTGLPGLYCVGDSTFPGQGLNAVAFSGFAAAHRVAVDLGLEPRLPLGLDAWLSEWISRRRLEWLGRGMQSTEDGTR
ncbi:hypothetical protein CDCA_CDCA04G1213 [Cyanidium caldarium]|uniref:prolycopene isomerase n=1 Tax=Cyanidium caldarium TaxID=2771 RepID=A0AAV9ITK6_CYACA|nr:hypothetical protein CDCA_CDCA04G1213 [Cyanidium caldarium]